MQWGETLNILKPLNTILAKVLLRDITDYHCIQESGVWILHAATVKPLVASAHFSRGSPQMTQLLVQRKCAQRANKEQTKSKHQITGGCSLVSHFKQTEPLGLRS